MKQVFAILFAFLSLVSFAQKDKLICSDSAEIIYVNEIRLFGNKITRDKLIFRELSLKSGDSLCKKSLQLALKHSKENLSNTSLFNFVEIHDSLFVVEDRKFADLTIHLKERWYIWPMPLAELAERNPNAWWETKDFSKINYGLFFTWENFRGKREALKFIAQGGYDETFGFLYSVPFINFQQTLGFTLGAGLIRNHEVTYQTIANKPVRYRDTDYLLYHYYAYVAFTIRKNIHSSHYFELEYNNRHYGDMVFQLNPEFDPYQNNKFNYFSLTYIYKNDHRDNKIYPLKGHYLDGILVKRGVGSSPTSNVNILSFTSNIRKYWALKNHWYFAAGFTGRVANTNRNPYFLNIGLGYTRDFVRGFEHYVIDGQNFALIKTDLKYGLFENKVMNLPVLPSKFNKVPWAMYMSFFADAAYSTTDLPEATNTLQNKSLFGCGAGLNLVSYYDIVVRLEYTYNNIGEKGFFVSLMTSI